MVAQRQPFFKADCPATIFLVVLDYRKMLLEHSENAIRRQLTNQEWVTE